MADNQAGRAGWTDRKKQVLFVVLAYAIFWVLLIVYVLAFQGTDTFSKYMPYVQIVGSWAPTIALLILFKKLYPGQTIWQWLKNAFKARLNFKLLLIVTIVLIVVDIGTVGFGALNAGVSFSSLIGVSFMGVVINIFSGATGEEPGWRGYLQPSVEKRHKSLIKSLLIVGIIWAFWHALTWINYINTGMAWFIPFDILDKMALAFIIGICYYHCRNLFVPMWIHFVSNLLSNWMLQSLNSLGYIAYILLEVLAAVGYIIWYLKGNKKEIPIW